MYLKLRKRSRIHGHQPWRMVSTIIKSIYSIANCWPYRNSTRKNNHRTFACIITWSRVPFWKTYTTLSKSAYKCVHTHLYTVRIIENPSSHAPKLWRWYCQKSIRKTSTSRAWRWHTNKYMSRYDCRISLRNWQRLSWNRKTCTRFWDFSTSCISFFSSCITLFCACGKFSWPSPKPYLSRTSQETHFCRKREL